MASSSIHARSKLMRSDRERNMRGQQVWATLIALALWSSLAACTKEPVAAAAGSGNEQVSAAAHSAAQPQPVVASPTAAERPEAAKPSPDEALAERVKSTLAGAGLGVLAVDIASADGAITLYGTVDSAAVRDQAG